MRITTRGWWLLFLIAALLVAGLAGPSLLHLWSSSGTHQGREQYTSIPGLVALALTLAAWYVWSWLSFAWRSRLAQGHLFADRMVMDENGPIRHMWTGRSFLVKIRLRLESPVALPYILAEDRLPFTVRQVSGQNWQQGPLRSSQPLTFEYRVRCSGMGRVRFEGVRVSISDLQGLFHRVVFLAAPFELRVLPVLGDDIGQPVIRKRFNLLPPPGAHRLLRPGTGSELLDLRDYLPGDPPRTIAWKVSARRDRLMTKEYESEVPVRCTLFVDISNSVRLGLPGKNALSRIAEIAAAVAQANTSMRDLTGLYLFDETSTKILRPARTARHLADLTNMLADAAGLPPTTGEASLESLMRLGFAFAEETYPQLMDDWSNRVPATLPRSWPLWRHYRSRRSPARWVGRGVAWLLASGLYFIVALGELAFLDFMYDQARSVIRPPPEEFVGSVYILVMVLLYLPFVRFFLDALPTALSAQRRRMARWRKKLAALLSVHYDLAPGGLAVLLEDNEQLSQHLQHFLGEHHVPYVLPFYDSRGRFQFASPAKVELLARSLLQSLGRGHDNELFVLMVDLLDMSDQLEPLLAAVRVALARHHQVVVILPWPTGEPPPTKKRPTAAAELDLALALPRSEVAGSPLRMRDFLQQLVRQHLNREYHIARKAFLRLGVAVVCAEDAQSVHVILERLERLRVVRSRR
jgi:uncharacterized protein (DUF58 family)